MKITAVQAFAETYYIGFAPHNPYGPINTMASLHVVASTPNFIIQEGGHADYDVLLQQPFPKQKDGYLDLPTGPGIGVELNEEALAAYPSPGMVPQDYHKRFKFPWRQQAHWI